MLAAFLSGLAALLATELAFTVAGWLALRMSTAAPRARVAAISLLLLAYNLAVFEVVTRRQVLALGVVFVFYHFKFTCIWVSALLSLRRDEVPPFFRFVYLTVFATRQDFGAETRDPAKLKRIGVPLLKEFALHMGYSFVVLALAGGLIQIALASPQLAASRFLFSTGAFVAGIELLAVWSNLFALVDALFGLHYKFFGNFTWLRSMHIGEFWRNWNVLAIRFFADVSRALGLRRRFFLNTMTIFFISGVMHQVLVWYYLRSLSWLTLSSFLMHGLAVWTFTQLYRKSRRWPEPVRALLFNPLTCLLVAALVSQPFVADLIRAATPVGR